MHIKRTIDIFATGVGLIVFAPLLLSIAVAILFFDGRPVFFRQERIGRGGKSFFVWKFRTMRHAAGGPFLTVAGDPRVTRFGHFLRRTKLDELPQLWNVLRGEMSLVGPRPEVWMYVQRYTSDQRRVLELTPGITDPASLGFLYEESVLAHFADPEEVYVERIMPKKIRLNLDYAAKATVVSDLILILRTIAIVVLRGFSTHLRYRSEEEPRSRKGY